MKEQSIKQKRTKGKKIFMQERVKVAPTVSIFTGCNQYGLYLWTLLHKIVANSLQSVSNCGRSIINTRLLSNNAIFFYYQGKKQRWNFGVL